MAKQIWKPGNMLYPLPVVMVSCKRRGEKPNIITIGWTATVNTSPPMTSISIRPSRYSYQMIKESGEFVINLTTKNLIYAADYCGVKSGRDVNKFDHLHLTPCESSLVEAPGILESPVNIECKVKEIKNLGSHDMFLAEVLAVHVDEKYMDRKGEFLLNQTGLVTYSHGEYFELGKTLGKFGFSVEKKKKNHKDGVKRKGSQGNKKK